MKTEAVCLLCAGQSWTTEVVGDEVVNWRCPCFKRRLARSFLGPELAKAPHRRSDLYRPEVNPETSEVVGDRTLDDLFIKGLWAEAAQHLRWAVGAKHYDDPGFSFKMVNDEMLLRVYLGHYHYHNRSKQVRDEVDTYNSLSDLVGSHSLLIIRLGKLAHPNRAAGNVLLEALNLRAAESKSTWLIEDLTFFGDGHKFYNDEVGCYIRDNFETINVGGDVEAARELEAQFLALRSESISLGLDESELAPLPQTRERYTAAPGAWENKTQNKKWGRGRGGKGGRLGDLEL